MKKMILGCFLYGTAIGLYAQAPQGDFKGSIQIGQTTMPIVFHFGEQNGQPVTTMDSPAQGVFGFPVQSSECLSDGELTLKIPQIQFCYVGKVRGDSLIEGTVTQAGQSLPLNLVRTARKAGASSEPERPGTPKPPFPYREEEVTVTTKDGIKLSDSLTLPEENMEAIETLAKGSPQVVTHIYPGLNHLFMEAPTGHPSEYGLLKGNFSQEVLQDMAEWIKKTVGAPQTAF